MHAVIKNTKTVEEFKELKKHLEQRATENYKRHVEAFGVWREGEISKVWIDKDGNVCIEYQSGNWWHYNEKGEWW